MPSIFDLFLLIIIWAASASKTLNVYHVFLLTCANIQVQQSSNVPSVFLCSQCFRSDEGLTLETSAPPNQETYKPTTSQQPANNQPTNQPTNKQTNKPKNKPTNQITNKQTNKQTTKPTNRTTNKKDTEKLVTGHHQVPLTTATSGVRVYTAT